MANHLVHVGRQVVGEVAVLHAPFRFFRRPRELAAHRPGVDLS
jgi:hypothetical protein